MSGTCDETLRDGVLGDASSVFRRAQESHNIFEFADLVADALRDASDFARNVRHGACDEERCPSPHPAFTSRRCARRVPAPDPWSPRVTSSRLFVRPADMVGAGTVARLARHVQVRSRCHVRICLGVEVLPRVDRMTLACLSTNRAGQAHAPARPSQHFRATADRR